MTVTLINFNLLQFGKVKNTIKFLINEVSVLRFFLSEDSDLLAISFEFLQYQL